jgi:hypothetical protein
VMSCCPLTSGTFLVSARQGPRKVTSTVAADNAHPLTVANDFQAASRAYPLRLPDQAQTHLRCCVFLI